MSAIAAAILVGFLVAALALVLRSFWPPGLPPQKVCRRCRNANPHHARYCAHCGDDLGH